MSATETVVLAINAGSSSVKYALYQIKDNEEILLFSDNLNEVTVNDSLIEMIIAQPGFDQVIAIGHRVVHGMGHTEPHVITPD